MLVDPPLSLKSVWYLGNRKKIWNMDGAGANMCKAVNIDGVAVKASFISRVCVGGKTKKK